MFVKENIIKKINILIYLVIIGLILISASFKYNEFSRNKALLNQSISEIEKNILIEYKQILKDSVNTTIIMIDSTYDRIINNHTKLVNIELNTILNRTKNYDEKKVYEYINKHKHGFFELTLHKTNNIINERVNINNVEFYISIKNKRIDKLFESAVRDFLYKNTTEDNRYTWINKILNFEGGDNYGVRLIHPNLKKSEGKLLSTNMKDIKGNKPYLEELNKIKKNREIYFKYNFKMINSDEISEKLSYAKFYKKQNWIIATGIPLSNLEENINIRKDEIKNIFKKNIYENIITQVVIFTLFIIVLLILKNELIKYFNKTKKLEEQLSKRLNTSEEQANSFFNLSINLQMIGNFNGEIIKISNSCKYILGYSIEELTHFNFLELLHPDDIKKTNDVMKELKNGKAIYYFENRYKHKDSHYITLAWSANANEDRTLIYSSAHDISNLKDNERMLFQQSKMASMGEMIEDIAHQWRQPLSILSTISTGIKLKNELGMLEKSEIEESMNDINLGVQHLSQTIDDFRSFFKADKKLTKFEISNCLEKTLKLISSQFKSADITIIKDIEDTTLYGLDNELAQVFINIINNAKDELVKKDIKRLIFIKIIKKEDYIEIKISDNAGGIQEILLSEVFESHFTTKEKTNGTGIGLYMSKIIIEEHMKGKLSVKNIDFNFEDIRYTGAEFNIILPINLKKEK